VTSVDDPVEIARRKERLIARCEAQRRAIADAVRALEGPISVADRGLVAARFLRAHPVVLAALVAVVVSLRGRTLLANGARVLALWRLWRTAGAWSQRFGLQFPGRRRQD